MKQVNLAVVIRDDYYCSIYKEENREPVSVYPEMVCKMDWKKFASEKDIDTFFDYLIADIKKRVPFLKEECSWLFSLSPGEYYLGFWERDWVEKASELGKVFSEAEVLKAFAEAEGQKSKDDYVDFCKELVLQIAKGLIYMEQDRR